MALILKGFQAFAIALALLAVTSNGVRAASSRFSPPAPQLEGLTRQTRLDAAPRIHLVVELQPKDPSLDALAASILDPASSSHRATLSKAAFDARFGRSQGEIDGLATWMHVHGAENVYASSNRLVVGGDFTLDQAGRALRTVFALYLAGPRRVIAPTTPLTIPVDGIRAVRGTISAFTPRLADTPTLPNDFRGAWFLPTRFREAYDAVENGGAGMRIALIEDASDAMRAGDVAAFLAADGAPPGASGARVSERVIVAPSSDAGCGRDDRGQEATIDVDAALTLAPGANVDVRYDQVCLRGSEGTLALQRALDDANAPNVIVFPFTVGPTYDAVATDWGPTSIPYLEAAVRGI
ncbi:MAG: protease pro-enzyme activation domain-containing protein, partial [Candidatus Baltobacteraceae bacterium]